MAQRYILTHPEYGIYIGNCMGLGLWSRMDNGGQDCVCSFDSAQTVLEYVGSWRAPFNDPAAYIVKPVECEGGWVTVPELKAAGLSAEDIGLLDPIWHQSECGHA